MAANPGVILTTIHDVENNLLVQAGNTLLAQSTDTPMRAYAAPITLHDSVAGYVTVTLTVTNNHHEAVMVTVAIIALLLALIAALSLHEHRAEVFIRRPAKTPEDRPDIEAHQSQDLDIGEDDDATEIEIASAFAKVRVTNLSILHQQLSADVFHATTSRLEQLLDEVLALYGGRRHDQGTGDAHQTGDYLLRFDDDSGNSVEAAFRAICGTWLVRHLAAQLRPFPLQLGVGISVDNPADVESTTAPVNSAKLLIEEDLANQPLLRDRLQLLDDPAHRGKLHLAGFQPPFGALLDRQYQQLKGK